MSQVPAKFLGALPSGFRIFNNLQHDCWEACSPRVLCCTALPRARLLS